VKRILKKTLACKEDLDTKLEDAVGSPASGETSVSGRIRRYYTNTYKSLDQFDQIWYECTYTKLAVYNELAAIIFSAMVSLLRFYNSVSMSDVNNKWSIALHQASRQRAAVALLGGARQPKANGSCM
jgi:hypothetical protein